MNGKKIRRRNFRPLETALDLVNLNGSLNWTLYTFNGELEVFASYGDVLKGERYRTAKKAKGLYIRGSYIENNQLNL